MFEIFGNSTSVNIFGTEISLGSLIVGATIMVIGVIVAKVLTMFFKKYFAANMEQHAAKNINKLIYYGIIMMTLLAVTTSQGIDLSGLMVAGGIFGIVIGFATQSVVANVISGLFLMVDKPAKTGDVVELPHRNIFGILMDITLFSTRIKLFDGSIMRVPNDKIFTEQIRNVAATEVRRIDIVVGIAYNEKIDAAINTIRNAILTKIPFVLVEPEPAIWTDQLADSSVNLRVLVWFPRNDWGEVGPILPQIIKESLDSEGITIPFPQRTIWYAQQPQNSTGDKQNYDKR
jgi:small-conductance mechanosensitive channel